LRQLLTKKGMMMKLINTRLGMAFLAAAIAFNAQAGMLAWGLDGQLARNLYHQATGSAFDEQVTIFLILDSDWSYFQGKLNDGTFTAADSKILDTRNPAEFSGDVNPEYFTTLGRQDISAGEDPYHVSLLILRELTPFGKEIFEGIFQESGDFFWEYVFPVALMAHEDGQLPPDPALFMPAHLPFGFFTPIPEPATGLLVLGGAAVLLLRRRRR